MERELVERVRRAVADQQPLCIRGGGTKGFYGRACAGEPLELSGHQGIVAYEPSELVITARAGTPLAEAEALLAANGQMFPFEPPSFGDTATIGGMVAAGLAGPRRPWGGAVRDAVLGVRLLNGHGEVLRLGGQVMKNVAGYDLSRLMAGALGTLGVLLEVSLKVLPRPAEECTLSFELDAGEAARRVIDWGRRALPVSATLYQAGRLYVRLSGGTQCLAAARDRLGGGPCDPGIWTLLRDQRLPFFADQGPLWRIALPPAASELRLPGAALVEWGGALRWLRCDLPAARVRERATTLGGHATLFRGHDGTDEVFHPLPPAMLALQRRVKHSFDPRSVFNPGRLYEGL